MIDALTVTRARKKSQPLGGAIDLLRVVALGWLALGTSHASQPVQVTPQFLFEETYDVYPPPYASWEPTLSQAYSDAASKLDGCWSSLYGCITVENLHPDTSGPEAYLYNNSYYYWYYFDANLCKTTCTYMSDWGIIQSTYLCPLTFSEAITSTSGSNPTQQTVVCTGTIPTQPPPVNCKSCIGNPIYAGTGLKIEPERDYETATGLSFVRTYRSDYGSWYSIANSTFIDYSQPSGTTLYGCYPAYWVYASLSWTTCLPYVSNAQSAYQLVTSDGQYIQFTGPNSAVTQSADINQRVTQVTIGGVTEWQVRREDDATELYSTLGSLLQRVERGGRTFTFTYSTSSTPSSIAPQPGLLLSESDAFGHTLSWQYNAQGLISQMTDPAGGVYQYTYNATGNLSSITYPDGTSRAYEYNESANTGGANLPTALTGVTDESNVRFATFQYQQKTSAGLPTAFAVNTQHAGGVDSYSFTYDSYAYYGSPITSTVVTDPLGTNRTYAFSSILSYNQDASVSQPAASGSGTVTESWSHDANGNISQQTDFNGNVTTYTFNLTRNLETSRTEAYGTSRARTIATVWDANWRQPDQISVYNGGTATGTPIRVTSFTYDSLGNVLTKTLTDMTVTPNASRTWTYSYDSYGRRLTAQGPRTDVNSTTTYSYYTCTTGSQCGELQTVTDPVGNVTTYNTYNAHGQPLTITDPNGVVTTLTYDARTRLTSRQVGSELTAFSYYPTGLLKQVTLPDSSYVLYTYDNAHRLIEISDGAGNSIQYTLDNMDNRLAEKTYDPTGTLHRTHTRVYNTLNELYQDINAAGTSAVTTTYAFDNDANQTAIDAPLSRNTANAYDPLNRLTQITDPNSGVTAFSYDAADDLTSVQDPRSLTTSYGYNGFGDVTSQVSPDTGSTANTYDSGGNLSTSTDARGSISAYTYDAANRVTSIVYTLGGTTDQTLAFGYDSGTDGKGRLTSASDANHSLAWSYDFLGRVVGKGLTVGTVNLSIGYAYTSGDLTAMVTPSGQAVAYGFNSNHQITSLTVNGTIVLSGVTYEPFGGVNGWTWGDGTTTSRTFNGDGLVSQIQTAGVTLGYSFDNANRISGITDSSNSALSWTYGFDSLDRLTSATTSAITEGWTYDADGNQLTETGTTPITFTPSTSSNQLTATTGSLIRSYSYDAAGHTLAYATSSFSYNNRGRMESTTSSSTDYLYNALGQMIEKSGTLGTTAFMQDEAGHLIGEYDGSGNLIEETIWLGDIPVATLQPNGSGGVNIFYVHTDHLNTPRKIAQPSTGTLAWRWDADPFGTAAPNQNPGGLGTFPYNLRFPGQYYQAETGLNQNWRRDYDAQVGRYVESDPIGLQGGNSTYAYVSGKPIMFTDPAGLEPCFVVGRYSTPWQDVPGSGGTPWYDLAVIGSAISGALVSCNWNMYQLVQQRRDVYFKLSCRKCDYASCPNPACRWVTVMGQKEGSETRPHVNRTFKSGYGGAFVGSNPEEPAHSLCTNPWTGEPAVGGFDP
jgi:RHS repeat-associated protein